MRDTTLDEAGITAVALAVAETLEKTPITARFLVDKKLDPSELADHFLASHKDGVIGFSATERQLYDRVLKECSRSIMDVASQLPAFTEQTFSELLKKGELLVEVTQKILSEVKKIRDAGGQLNQEDAEARFEFEYRLAVGRRMDELELFGVDFASSVNRRHRLSVAYVTLSVSSAKSGTIKPKAKVPASDTNGEHEGNLVSVNLALTTATRMLVRGQAGSGKTTLLQWIAVKAATRSFEPPLDTWNAFIPFFIRLRDFVETSLPKPEDFPSLVAPEVDPESWTAGDGLHKHDRNCPTCPKNDASIVRR